MIKSSKPVFLLFFCFSAFFISTKVIFSSTSINITDTPIPITDIDTNEITDQIQYTTDLNGPFIANAFALANVLGYPIGKSTLGKFPHFQLGIAAGSGCTNMEYFDDKTEDDTLPMFAPNPVIHVGVGLFGGLDLLAKMFYISKSAVNRYKSDIDYERSGFTLSDYLIYSTGVKLRYNYIKEKKILPLYLSFGGITFSLGGNFMYGNIKFTGDYTYDFEDVTVDVPPPTGTTSIPMHFDGQFSADIHWAIFSLDAQAIAYFDIFYLFSFYTGFGLACNIGSFKLESGGVGYLTTDNAYPPLTNDQFGTLTFSSKNKYRPSRLMPLYILGLEINIFVVKLNVETMVNMLNRSDVNIQFGTRVQI